jgi:hypothetical protein
MPGGGMENPVCRLREKQDQCLTQCPLSLRG